jgi:biopolymer transport protein ExbD
MKKHAAVAIAAIIIIYTLVIDFRFIWVMRRIMAYQAYSRITPPGASFVVKPFNGVVIDFAADASVYMGGKRMTDEDLKKFLLANPGIKIELRGDCRAKYSAVKALLSKLSAWGVKDITLKVVEAGRS